MAEKDISIFIDEFNKTDCTLSDFNSLWKKRNMSLIIFCSPNPKEFGDYLREIFEHLIVGISNRILVGKSPFFMLYAFFTLQLPVVSGRINIPVTKDEFTNLKMQVQSFCNSQELDVVYLFNKLLSVNAFEIIPIHETIRWGAKALIKERFVPLVTKNQAYQPPVALKALLSDGTIMSKLDELTAEYTSAKKSVLPGRTILDCVTTNLTIQLSGMELEYDKEMTKLRNAHTKDDNTRSTMRASAKKVVRDKAFNAPVDTRGPLLSRVKQRKPRNRSQSGPKKQSAKGDQLDGDAIDFIEKPP